MCAQSLFKLQPEHDVLFARIAAAAPAARFSFLTAATARQAAVFEQRLHAELHRHSVDPSRFRILPALSADQYAHELASADLLLDTIGFSGGMTTLDSLWQERPVLTLPGQLMRGRQSYAMLKQLGLDDLIASDPDDYVRRAAALAQNGDQRNVIRKQIRERKHQLFEDRPVCTALAEFLRTVEPSGTTPHPGRDIRR
jgi:predicted O-linked N-acetylglucosamine transferase (SPINDLY family)